MEATFPKFRDLPTELRIDIWKHALPPRIVSIQYKSYDFYANPVHQTHPTLLRVCRESRELALRLYKLRPPTLDAGSEAGSSLHGAASSRRKAQDVAEASGLVRIDFVRRGMVEGPNGQGRVPESRARNKSNDYPLWLDVSNDVLLFKRGTFWPTGFNFQLLRTPTASNFLELKHIAFDVDWLPSFAFPPAPAPATGRRSLLGLILRQLFVGWIVHQVPRPHLGPISISDLDFIRMKEFSNVESIAISMRERHEVMKVSLDDTSLLRPNEWSFSLDTQDRTFEQHMGEEWSGIVWDVRLGRDNDQGLWSTACKFTPDLNLWLAQKTYICKQAQVDRGWIEPNKYSFTPRPPGPPGPPPPPPLIRPPGSWPISTTNVASRPLPLPPPPRIRPSGPLPIPTTHAVPRPPPVHSMYRSAPAYPSSPPPPPPPPLILRPPGSWPIPTTHVVTRPLPPPTTPDFRPMPTTNPEFRPPNPRPPPIIRPPRAWPSYPPPPPPPPPLSRNLPLTEDYPPPKLLEGGDGRTYRGE
ncbi:uncharacterized protein PAC_04064 [Phialocephala subalpina]|uniref:2EXR domain-containing protein n=1 Tax=Phialocephala subalpina TaxID=576137 RepID=A0A1L7WN31_9HELO|nr:uncharacterized protein PAC_04064 [Phialocephala subalpina]